MLELALDVNTQHSNYHHASLIPFMRMIKMPLFAKKNKPAEPFVSAVVAAAGSASRMQGTDKQLAELGGIPTIARSVAALSACPRVREIVVVCREEQIAEYYDVVRFFRLDKVVSVVAGSEHRQGSVFAGIMVCSKDADFYAIHDGARPLVLPGDIDACIDIAMETGAAAVGTRVKDTIKICDTNAGIISTPNREALWAVQTPQIFASGLYRRAMEAATRVNRQYTDDCQLIENFGHRVVISEGSFENIKITTPADIVIAEAILSMREEML